MIKKNSGRRASGLDQLDPKHFTRLRATQFKRVGTTGRGSDGPTINSRAKSSTRGRKVKITLPKV